MKITVFLLTEMAQFDLKIDLTYCENFMFKWVRNPFKNFKNCWDQYIEHFIGRVREYFKTQYLFKVLLLVQLK